MFHSHHTMNLGLIFWTLLLLGPLLWLARRAHEGTQELVLLLTGHKMLAVYLHQILLFPGVALHEFSHFLAASLLGVRVREVSLRPDLQGEKVQMGAVVIEGIRGRAAAVARHAIALRVDGEEDRRQRPIVELPRRLVGGIAGTFVIYVEKRLALAQSGAQLA